MNNVSINQTNMNLDICVGLGKVESVEKTRSNSSVNFDSVVLKTLHLSCPDQTVAEFTRDLVERYIPQTWFMHVVDQLKSSKNCILLDYGAGCPSMVQLHQKPSELSNLKKRNSLDVISVRLKIGESDFDSAILCSDDSIRNYVDKWNISSSSSSLEIVLLSARMSLWLDFKKKESIPYSQCTSKRFAKHSDLKQHFIDYEGLKILTKKINLKERKDRDSLRDKRKPIPKIVASAKKRRTVSRAKGDESQINPKQTNIGKHKSTYCGIKREEEKVYKRRKRSDPPLMRRTSKNQ